MACSTPDFKSPTIVGNKVMMLCPLCGKLVRIDKPILGSMHVCAVAS